MKRKTTLLILILSTTILFAQRYEEKPIQIITPQEHYINSVGGTAVGSLFAGKQNKLILEVRLPENTVRWFYTFSASRDEADIQRTKKSLNLLADLTRVIDQTGTTANAAKLINTPPGSDYSNVYLLASREDANKFDKEFTLKSFYYNQAASRENYKSGVVEVSDSRYISGSQFLGFQNPAGA